MALHVGKFLNNVFPEQILWKIVLLKNWGEIAGKMAGKVKIEKIENDMLVLGVLHSAWAQEVSFVVDDIKNKVNSFLKEEKIKNIRIKLSALKVRKKGNCIFIKKQQEIKKSKQRQVLSYISNSEHKILKDLKDKELSKFLEQFCIRCKRIY